MPAAPPEAPAPSHATPRGGPPVLDYGTPGSGRRLTAGRIPVLLTPFVSAAVCISAAARRPPVLVVAAVTLLATGLWYVYARARAARPAFAPALLTDQLVLAMVLCMGGVYSMLNRAGMVSTPFYWLPYNQTYQFHPQWALQPLWYSAAGLAWFAIAWVLIRRRDRAATAAATCPAPADPE
jgi:hypothetical protein